MTQPLAIWPNEVPTSIALQSQTSSLWIQGGFPYFRNDTSLRVKLSLTSKINEPIVNLQFNVSSIHPGYMTSSFLLSDCTSVVFIHRSVLYKNGGDELGCELLQWWGDEMLVSLPEPDKARKYRMQGISLTLLGVPDLNRVERDLEGEMVADSLVRSCLGGKDFKGKTEFLMVFDPEHELSKTSMEGLLAFQDKCKDLGKDLREKAETKGEENSHSPAASEVGDAASLPAAPVPAPLYPPPSAHTSQHHTTVAGPGTFTSTSPTRKPRGGAMLRGRGGSNYPQAQVEQSHTKRQKLTPSSAPAAPPPQSSTPPSPAVATSLKQPIDLTTPEPEDRLSIVERHRKAIDEMRDLLLEVEELEDVDISEKLLQSMKGKLARLKAEKGNEACEG